MQPSPAVESVVQTLIQTAAPLTPIPTSPQASPVSAAVDKPTRSLWRNVLFFAIHALALGGAIYYGIRAETLLLVAAVYLVGMFSITAGYHRYFSHRSFKTSRLMQFILAWFAQQTAQRGILWWAAHHRHHHKHSDETTDVHSPKHRGFWYSHVGWVLNPASDHPDRRVMKDLSKFWELRFLDRFHLLPPFVMGFCLWLIGGWEWLVFGTFVSTVILWHCTYTINSLCHLWGKRVYDTTDTSRNNFWLALLTLGEGWHNNHHYFQSSARQGFRWWEIDLTWSVLWVWERLGLIWDVKRPTPKVLAARMQMHP